MSNNLKFYKVLLQIQNRMTNLLSKEDDYNIAFADSMYAEFLRLRFGLATCKDLGKMYLNQMRKEIVDYQKINNGEIFTLCETVDVPWPALEYSCQSFCS